MKSAEDGNAMTLDARLEQGEGEGVSSEEEEDDSDSSMEDSAQSGDEVECDESDGEEADDSDEDDETNENDVIVPMSDQQVNVEFEAFPPSDTDFQSLVALLGRLFYKQPDINLAELANWIIGHNYIGSVLKTNMDGNMDDSEDSEDEESVDEDDTVYGVTTVVSLKKTPSGKEEGFKKSIVDYLNSKCNSPELSDLLSSSSKHVGLLLTERFINIPPLLAPPMLKCLNQEIEAAKKKKMPYDFSHILLISKTFDMSGQSAEGLPPCLEFIQPEDEIFQQHAQVAASFPVPEAEPLVGGSWGPEDKPMGQYRTISLLTNDKFKAAVNKIAQVFTVENMMSLMDPNAT